MTEQKQKKICDILDQLDIPFEIQEHPPVYTIEEMELLQLGKDGDEIAKNLFLRDSKGKRHFLVVLRKDKKADLKELRGQIGSTALSFASEERLEQYLGLTKGAVTPFGIIHDTQHAVEILLDEDLRKSARVGVHPNVNTATVWLSPHDLERFIKELGNPLRFIRL